MHSSRNTLAPPLTPQTFYILLALAEKPRYGYVIAQKASEYSVGSVNLPPGTLYSALARLATQKLIKPVPDNGPIAPGKSRQYYEITDRGRQALHQERRRLERAVIIARQTLLGPTQWRVQ